MAQMIAPPAVVTGAGRAALPFGLFSVLAPRTGSADRWEAGVIWETGTCEPAGGRGRDNCDPDDQTIGLPKDFQAPAEDGEATEFTVYGSFVCSPVGTSPQEAQAAALDHLLAREEARVERALWTGDLGNVPNFSGANGYPAPTTVPATNIVDALDVVEGWLGRDYGSLGVVHMSRENALAAIKEDVVEVRGNSRLFTALGTPVVAGAGYPSSGVVGTPALFGYRSEPFTSSARPGDLLNRATNTLYGIAERTYLIGFDPCGLILASLETP